MPHRIGRLKIVLLTALLVCLVTVLLARFVLPHYLIDYVRERSVRIVKERFHADVQFGEFDIKLLFPRLVITGANVKLTRGKQDGVPPLIFVRSFTVEADLFRFVKTPAHIHEIRLDGMSIHIPPRTGNAEKPPTRESREHYPVVVDGLVCADCELDIYPKRPDKEPLHFAIHRLMMENVGLGRSAPYQAQLTNAVPKGEIDSSGRFGPWEPDLPSLTPLAGTYNFSHADLDPFPGISGTLESTGKFEGRLERIVADGETTMPDFALDTTDHPVPLNTQFHAIIDGMSGDTALEPVKAQFLHSSLVATGGVFGVPGTKGKEVLLDVTVNPGRLEDLLRLGVKADRPPMVGNIRFHTKLDLPPGTDKISKRLKLDGHFVASNAEPTDPALQRKFEKLSRRAEGHPEDRDAGSAVFDLKCRFILNRGLASFPRLTFTIPGAKLNLAGEYGLHSEKLNFQGELRLKAKLSQTTTGVKSFFLKLVDPFFKGTRAGAVLPVKVTGTREHPSFGLDLHQRPEGKAKYEAEERPSGK
jgi:hypothetical protein